MKMPPDLVYRPLIASALRGVETLTPADKADVYEAIAELSRPWDGAMSRSARELATALRDAEGLQLHFRNLFPDA